MRRAFLFFLLLLSLNIFSCTVPFAVYLRNPTSEKAMVDIFLLDKTDLGTLPNKVKVAHRLIIFKSGFKKFINSRENVTWIDTSHFKFEIKPHTTVDLTDMAGKFINSYPRENVRVIISANSKTDTLLNGKNDFRYSEFEYKKVGIASPVLYYDIK